MPTSLYALMERRPNHARFGAPFYFGIGTAKRPKRHVRETRSRDGHRNPGLHATLSAHLAMGVEPGIRIVAICPDRAYAGLVERRAIAAYGREGIDEGGILCNIAKGGQGPDSALMQLPEIRKRNSEGQKRRSAESKARSLAALLKCHSDPELKARKSANSRAPQKKSWADPEIRAKRVAAMRGKKKTRSPAFKAAVAKNGKQMQSPGARAARAATMRDLHANEEFREKRSNGLKRAWADPVKRAAFLANRTRKPSAPREER